MSTKLTLSPTQLQQLLSIAHTAAAKAAALINESFEKRYEQPLEIESKSSSTDLVTQYDKQCEEIVLAEIDEQCALWLVGDHATQKGTDAEGKRQCYSSTLVGGEEQPIVFDVLSEETRNDVPLEDCPTWIVDPIDGTTAFVHGGFDCCVSIGLALNKIPIIGVVNCPRTNEVFTGVEGAGSFCNGRRIHVSGCTHMNKALICTHTSYNRSTEAIEALLNINRKFATHYRVHGIRTYGAAAMDMCSVAMGRLDMYLEAGIQAWDMCAGTIIVREAGGIVSSLDKLDFDTEKNIATVEGFNLMSQSMCCAGKWQLAKEGIDTCNEFNYRHGVLFTE